MAYKTLKEALNSITQSTHKVKGKEYVQWYCYLGVNSVDGKAKRMWSPSRERLEQDVREFYKSIKKGGEMVALLTPMQIMDAKTALETLAEKDISLSLTECAKRVVAQISASACVLTVKECFNTYMKEKNTSALDIKATNSRVGKWVECCSGGMKIVDIKAETVTDWLAVHLDGKADTTWNQYKKYIDTFLRWCAKKPRQWIAESPLAYVPDKRVAWKEPECISVDNAKILFSCIEKVRDAHPEYIAYAALSFFCGIRREEILRIAGKDDDGSPAANINLDTGAMAILKPKGFLKGIKPRAFTITDTALAWMKSVDFKTAIKRIGEDTAREIYALAREAGATIPKNCGRHSFITYHVCAYENLAKTLMVAGTSEGMSEDHYRALRSREEGLAYFGILPTCSH